MLFIYISKLIFFFIKKNYVCPVLGHHGSLQRVVGAPEEWVTGDKHQRTCGCSGEDVECAGWVELLGEGEVLGGVDRVRVD